MQRMFLAMLRIVRLLLLRCMLQMPLKVALSQFSSSTSSSFGGASTGGGGIGGGIGGGGGGGIFGNDLFQDLGDEEVTMAYANMKKQLDGVLEQSAAAVSAVDSSTAKLAHQLQQQTQSIDQLLGQANAQQLQALSVALSKTQEEELTRRKRWEQREAAAAAVAAAEEGAAAQAQAAAAAAAATPPVRNGILPGELDQMLAPKTIFSASEEKLELWIQDLMDDALEELDKNGLPTIPEIEEITLEEETEEVEEDDDDDEEEDDEEEEAVLEASVAMDNMDDEEFSHNCVSPETAVRKIQEAISDYAHDGIGVDDHATGASIVYEMTSETFVPPGRDNSNDALQKLGNVWWRKYIPEDWENALLPEGWTEWNTAWPVYLSHTLRSLLPPPAASSLQQHHRHPGGSTSHSGGLNVVPPETILEPHVQAGSCWPLKGRSGRVTFTLPYPVRVQAVTLDHVSGDMLLGGRRERSSAPKRVRVVGYPACSSPAATSSSGGRNSCGGLPFNPAEEIVLAEFTYDLDGPSIQTFPTKQADSSLAAADYDAADAEADGGDGSGSGASCSAPTEATTGTCSGPKDAEVFKAIQVQVLENWGKQDFTCLYRFRVHGDPVVASSSSSSLTSSAS